MYALLALTHRDASELLWKERYTFATGFPLVILVSVLLSIVEILIIISFLKPLWDIYLFLSIRKPKNDFFFYALKFSFQSILFLLVINVFFDLFTEEIHFIGYIRLLLTYGIILLVDHFFENKSIVVFNSILLSICIRFIFSFLQMFLF
ncbi:hypothetical protein [Enterococcus phoeniculicola]